MRSESLDPAVKFVLGLCSVPYWLGDWENHLTSLVRCPQPCKKIF